MTQNNRIGRQGPKKGSRDPGTTGMFLTRFLVAFFVVALLPVAAVQAGNPDGALRIEIISAYNLVVDSNVTAPSTYAPEAATLGAKVCNDGTEVMNEVQVYIGDYIDGTGTNDKPGTYPEYDSSVAGAPVHVAGTGTYSLTHESGSFANNEDASRAWVGTLEPGECRVEYWVVSYPRCVNVETSPSSGVYEAQEPPCDTSITGGSTHEDDITLSYDIWATGSYGAAETSLTAEDSRSLTLRSEISASANKIWPNGDNKVPDEYKVAIEQVHGWDTWTPTGSNPYPGQVFETQGIWYDLGNVNHGFDNNNDGVPDQNAWVQPVGIPDVYDPGCFRLVGTYGLLIVKLSSGGEQLIPFRDQMYFENIPDNTGVVGLVFYEYVALNGVCTGTLTPYQEVASGYLNEKFSGDYGTAFDITTQEPKAYITKGVSPLTAAVGSELTYTLEVTNPDDYGLDSEGDPLTVTIGDPDSGSPLVIRDTIPPDTNFLLNSAKVVEPDSDIAKVDVTILYTYSDGTTTWTTTAAPTVQSDADPATFDTADDVVALEWRAEVGLGHDDGGKSMKVEFAVNVPSSGYDDPFVSNIGCAAIGSGPCFDEDDAVTTITGSTSITGTVFEDDGTGSNNGNGTYDIADTGEIGIAGVPVSIYFDADGSGTYSEGDFLWEDMTTDANGEYTSSSTLPAGDWFVVVGDLPISHDGWASTTGTVHTVTTTTGEATAPDTGFAPALTLDKQFIGTPPANEGDAVTYTIDLNNELYAEGVAVSGGCEYLVWSSAESATNSGSPASKQFSNTPNAFGAQGPDGVYASGNYTGGNNQFITGSSFNIDPKSGNITKVEALAQLYIATALVADYAHFTFYDGTNKPPTSNIATADLNTAVGAVNSTAFSWDVTGIQTWDWAMFASTSEFGINLAKSTGSADDSTLYLDALGYRITTDAPCENSPSTIIDPLPLYDTFDANKLEFASASPTPDRLVPYDDGDPTTDMYRIEWDNLGPLNPSETNQVTVNFTALEPTASPETVTNTAEVENAYFTSGTPANDADDAVIVNLDPTASIGDLIWFDANGDGIQDDGEPGIPGVTMYLCSTTPCNNGSADQTVVTDSNGNYQFDHLDGTYYVAVDTNTLPDGFDLTPIAVPPGGSDDQSDAVNITGGVDNMDQDWGFTSTAGTITGSVWQDFDGDASRDSNDTPFAGWVVTLHKPDGTTVTTTTNADGTYSFGNLPDGDYYTTVMPPADYTQTYDYDDTLNNNSGTLTISGNTFISDVDFAYQTGTNSIGDTLYVDLNGDGVEQTGEPGLADITVSLYLDSGSVPGVLDPGDVLLGSEETDSNGQYDFTNLPDGNYLVIPDKDDVDFPPVQQTGDPDESGTCTVCNGMTSVSVLGGQDIDTADFGYEPTGGMIGDSIYWDVNGDGTQGTNEPGIEGVEVYLCTTSPCTSSNSIASTTTDADGKYLFYGLPDADYTVSIGSIPGDPVLTADPDADGAVCPAAGTGETCDGQQSVSINGNTYMGADFGYQPTMYIGDQVFIDTDDSGGNIGVGDVPIPYVTVTLKNSDGDPIATTETDENGNYYFVGNYPAGSYTVTVDANPLTEPDFPTEYGSLEPSYNGPIGTDQIDTDGDIGNSITFTLGADPIVDADFGYKFVDTGVLNTLSGTICLEGTTEADSVSGGYCGDGVNVTDPEGIDSNAEVAYSGTTVYVSKWTDADNDGEIDAGELVPITQTDTNENGNYEFSGLPSVSGSNESYIVSLDAPADLIELTTYIDKTDGEPANEDTPADLLKEYTDLDGHTTSVWQSISVADDSTVQGLDFAFQQTAAFDFGDLPLPFETTLGIDGARHIVPDSLDPDLYLGGDVTTEADGKPSAGAIADEDDGIVPVNPADCSSADPSTSWSVGSGGAVEVTAVGDGWLVGWLDFNGDGSLSGSGEMIFSAEVVGGQVVLLNDDGTSTLTSCVPFSIPGSAVDTSGNFTAPGYARFRLFPEKPPVPSIAFKGIADNGEVEDYLFDLAPLSTIGDSVLLDTDNDGVGDAPIPGAVVELRNEYCNAGVDCPTAVTDANGHYLFTGVGLGEYTVVVTELPDGTPPLIYDLSPDPSFPLGRAVVNITESGTEFLDADFWYGTTAPTGTIGDRIWNDADGDGVQDMGESGIGGIDVILTVVDGGGTTHTYNTTTATDGSYMFTDLPAGNYTVTVDNPPVTDPLNRTGDPEDNADNETSGILSAGQTILTADFGYDYDTTDGATTTIGDRIWYDENGDVAQDPGEPGIAGVTVVLKVQDGVDGSGDPIYVVIAEDVTDANGNYSFPGLLDGTYIVEVSDTNGALDSYVPSAVPPTTITVDNTAGTCSPATTCDAVDFGYKDPAPTYATVSTFNAYVDVDNQVVLEWKTASEIGTIGFLLERLNEQSGKYQAVTKQLLPGMLRPPHGGTYRYVDKQAEPGKSFTYRVVEVDVHDRGVVSGPYTVQASLPLPVDEQMLPGQEGYALTHQGFSRKQLVRFAARDTFQMKHESVKKQQTGTTLKVPVSRDGLVYLSAAELATASGLAEREVVKYIKVKKLLITLADTPVSMITANTGSGLWFYGRAPERNDIGQNIYLLQLGKKGVKMRNAPGRAEEAVLEEQSFTAHVNIEENQEPFHLYINKPVSDFWAWEYLMPFSFHDPVTNRPYDTVTHRLDTPYSSGSTTAVLAVNLVGVMSTGSSTAAPYKVSVSLNGVDIGIAEWSAVGDYQFQAEVPADLLSTEGNDVKLVSQRNSGINYSLVYLESFEITYDREYQAVNGELVFSDGGYEKVTVRGFSSSDVLALDITDPDAPVRVRTFPDRNEFGEYMITVLTKPGHEYFISENISSTVSGELVADVPSDLKNSASQADYLVVSPLSLMGTVQRLADYREKQGLRTLLVDIEDIQDEFSHSLAAPEALRDFLAYVYQHWTQVPKYVVLIGDGSYDYKNYLDYGYPLVPSMLVQTPDAFFPSDNAFTDVVGNDRVPEFAIGRIPVVDSAELNQYIDKLIAYEQSLPQRDPLAVVVTGKKDPAAGDFQASAEKITALLPEDYPVQRLDVDALGKDSVRNGLVNTLEQGSHILHYIGHSSLVAYGNELLTADEIDDMSNIGPAMLMVSMACSTASFGYPPMNSIGESAVLKADGAAVGFYGATGLSYNYQADIIAKGFYTGLFYPGVSRVGDAVVSGKQYYFDKGMEAYTLDIYNLLGDPAMSVPKQQ